MLFHYLAQDSQGRVKEGNINQPNTEAVLEYLTTQKLKPLSVKPLMLEKGGKGLVIFGKLLVWQIKFF